MDTYEYNDLLSKIETFEWDSTWIEHTENTQAKRVYYIGDSISNGLRRMCTEASGNEFLFDGCATSKSLDNPWYHDTIALFGKQLPKVETILFNMGLHGWHLDDTEGYPFYYEKTVEFLLKEFPGARLVLVLTTRLADRERNERVKLRNKAALSVADKFGLPVIDLFTLSEELAAYQHDDGCHFKNEGNEKMAEYIIKELKKITEM